MKLIEAVVQDLGRSHTPIELVRLILWKLEDAGYDLNREFKGYEYGSWGR